MTGGAAGAGDAVGEAVDAVDREVCQGESLGLGRVKLKQPNEIGLGSVELRPCSAAE